MYWPGGRRWGSSSQQAGLIVVVDQGCRAAGQLARMHA
jgi:hypothetical protein